MSWLIFWIAIYLLVVIVLSLRHIKSNDLEQYLVNNRNTRTLPLVFTVLATFVGGGTSIGLMALGYESGFAAVAIGVAYVIGLVLCGNMPGKSVIMELKIISIAFLIFLITHTLQ